MNPLLRVKHYRFPFPTRQIMVRFPGPNRCVIILLVNPKHSLRVVTFPSPERWIALGLFLLFSLLLWRML